MTVCLPLGHNSSSTTAVLRGGRVCVCVCVCMLSCVQLFYNPMDCSPLSSSVRGILQARILEWVAMPFSRGSSRPRDLC